MEIIAGCTRCARQKSPSIYVFKRQELGSCTLLDNSTSLPHRLGLPTTVLFEHPNVREIKDIFVGCCNAEKGNQTGERMWVVFRVEQKTVVSWFAMKQGTAVEDVVLWGPVCLVLEM
jgi:hypothetical protein